MKTDDKLDMPYLEPLMKRWGMEKLEVVTHYSRTAIYQWKPSRVPVPAEVALRVSEFAETPSFEVEVLRPDLPWHLVYGGRDRRKSYEGVQVDAGDLDALVRHIGVTEVARAAGRSRQNVYNAARADNKCPAWLALAIEQASGQRHLVEDVRPELPWWPLYSRRERVYPLRPLLRDAK